MRRSLSPGLEPGPTNPRDELSVNEPWRMVKRQWCFSIQMLAVRTRICTLIAPHLLSRPSVRNPYPRYEDQGKLHKYPLGEYSLAVWDDYAPSTTLLRRDLLSYILLNGTKYWQVSNDKVFLRRSLSPGLEPGSTNPRDKLSVNKLWRMVKDSVTFNINVR